MVYMIEMIVAILITICVETTIIVSELREINRRLKDESNSISKNSKDA